MDEAVWLFYPCKGVFLIHSDHLIFLFCHSYVSPIVKVIRNIRIMVTFFVVWGSIGNDRTRAISISKIKNRMDTIKN